MEKLYEFYWDCGRQGSVNGMFIADAPITEIPYNGFPNIMI